MDLGAHADVAALRAARRDAVRAELGAATGRAPEALEVRRTATGRPFLHPPGPDFSVSHSGSLLAVAVASAGAGGSVGVDVERLRPRRRLGRIAARAFPDPVAADVLAAATEAERLERFYRFWTAYEAFAKALGAGLGLPARELSVSAGGEPDALLLSHPAAGGEPWAGRYVPLAGAIACVATAAPRCTVTRRTAPG